MAKFSEQFLASLTQPPFAKSMFNLGTAIGSVPTQIKQKRETEKFRAADTEGRFDIAIERALKANDIAAATSLTARKESFLANKKSTEAAALVRQNTAITDIVSNNMISNGTLTEVPTSITINNKQVKIDPNLRDDILAAVNTKVKVSTALEESLASLSLDSFFIDYIDKSPVLQENALVQKSLGVLEDRKNPNKTISDTQVRTAIAEIKKAVDAEEKRQRSLSVSSDVLEVRVRRMIEDIKKKGSNTPFWKGNDMADFLNDGDEEQIELFIKQAVAGLKQNPSLTDSQIIDFGMSGMKEEITGQDQSEDIEASKAAAAQMKEEAILGLMTELNLTREQAEVEYNRRTSPPRASSVGGGPLL